jgi:phosphate acetyltransferase
MADSYQKRIMQAALESKARIILPEGDDIRIQEAKIELLNIGFTILDINDSTTDIEKYIDNISRLKFTRNWTLDQKKTYLSDPLNLGMAMIANEDADGLVAGACTATSDVIRTALRLVGVKPKSKWISSIFLMISPEGEKAFSFSDCGVIPEPNSEQLAVIARDAAEFHTLLTGETPKVAFLSFSTKGSAEHYRVDRVREARNIFNRKYPEIIHDGELQLDAAIIPEIAHRKMGVSTLNGQANILIFPNLDAGNIAYKITERLAGYSAWGPLLQGLQKPVQDLSRGCSVDDIINITAITAMQGGMYAHI